MSILSDKNIEKNIHEDLFVSFLRSQINSLMKVLNHIEQGNDINGYVNENIKCVEKDLRWLRYTNLKN